MKVNHQMGSIIFVLAISLCLCSVENCIASQPPESESVIKYSSVEGGTCNTQNKEIVSLLKQIRLSQASVLKGVSCIKADFDNNGSYDFVFFGPFDDKAFWSAQPGEARFQYEPLFIVIFFEKSKLLKSQILKNHGKDHIALYGPMAKKGEFGEPPSDKPGLIQHGEGGDTYIYLYDPKIHQLVRSSYPSEYH
jgi:hypothetical protein